MNKWYHISNTKLFIVLGISVLWIIAGILIYEFIGSKHGPEGGLDSIADAIVYVFFWRLLIYALPVLASLLCFLMWMFQKHRKAFIWLIIAAVVCFACSVVYNKYLKKYVDTPKHIAEKLESFEEWKKRQSIYGVNEKYTESDYICEYLMDTVSDAAAECRCYYSAEDIDKKTEYINAAMEAHYSELAHVKSWEYIPDVRKLIPARKDGDDEFLLNNSELCKIAEHYGKTLRTDHWYDRYMFKDSVIAEWYSWLPMMAVIYDDGSMDLLIAAG